MESLHEMKSVDLNWAGIGDDGVKTLATALKKNTTVTELNLVNNAVGDEGASALADALKVNSSVTTIWLGGNRIRDEGAAALADALKVNTSMTIIFLSCNNFGKLGALALADALKVNTSVTYISLYDNAIDESNISSIDAVTARNKHFRSLFLFDARRMLLSLMCADECGVVWPYLLGNGNTDGVVAPDHLESIRAELAGVVAERRSRLHASAP
jgi:Ran GTPase-activating protein (RanGAP) involved in mRNA processing and transport